MSSSQQRGSASTSQPSPSYPLRLYLTKYEKTKVIGIRAEQLIRGAQPLVALAPDAPFDAYSIAEQELMTRRLPYIIVRTMPDGSSEQIKLEDMVVA